MMAVRPVGDEGVACGAQGQSGGQFRTIVNFIVRVALWPVRVATARRSFAPLAQMSDSELHDIGLTRQDLWNASALPLDQDPTAYLAQAATDFSRHRRGLGQ